MGIVIIKIYNRIISIIKKMKWFVVYGKKVKIGKKSVFYPKADIVLDQKGCVKIGTHCFFNKNCSITSMKYIQIGNDCIFGENVKLYDHNHNHVLNGVPFRMQGYSMEEIIIGNNVWIGSNVVILAGVHIGDNVVIGASTVITHNVPDDSLVYCKNKIQVHNMKKKDEEK